MQPFVLLFVACALSGIAIPMPEDVALLTAGSTVDDPLSFAGLALAGTLGLLCRDGVFFGIGHVMGEGVFGWRVVKRRIGADRIRRGRALVEANGGRAVLLSRFMIGARATGFLVAGALGVRPRDFLFWDVIGLVFNVPVMLLLGFAFSEPIGATVSWLLDHKGAVGVVGLLIAAGAGIAAWRSDPAPEAPAD